MEIQVASYRHDCARALANIDLIATALVAAKAAPGHALCLCTAPARKLVIRTLGRRHFLAVWPHDGHNHHYACPFHRDEDLASKNNAGTEPAVKETTEGFDIATDFPLERELGHEKAPGSDRIRSPAGTGPNRVTRSRMGLLGILQHLWIEARLNQWGATWKRDWWRVTQELLPVMEQGSLGRRPMTEWLYLVPEFKASRKEAIEAAWQAFRSRLGPNEAAGGVRHGLLLGEAKHFETSAYGYKLSVRHFPAPLFLSAALRDKLATSYPRAFHRIGEEDGQRVICLCLVELTGKGNLNAIDASLMAASTQYIPVDSAYEAHLAQKLVEEKRSFSKPLRFSLEDSALPDFVLSDTNPPYVLEVFGMTHSAYLERKAQKLDGYRAEGKPVWVWNADRESQPPRLPEPSSFRGSPA